MKYTEQQQSSPLSCDGCVFCRQTHEKKSVKDPSNPKHKKVIDKPTGLYGCYAPKGEPYSSCLDRGVVLTEEKG